MKGENIFLIVGIILIFVWTVAVIFGQDDIPEEELSCKQQNSECRYKCADSKWIETTDELDSCLRKCEIKKEVCD